MQVHVTFIPEKITKRTIRYREVDNSYDKRDDKGNLVPVVGALYVQKEALKVLGEGDVPKKLEVTIEVGD